MAEVHVLFAFFGNIIILPIIHTQYRFFFIYFAFFSYEGSNLLKNIYVYTLFPGPQNISLVIDTVYKISLYIYE